MVEQVRPNSTSPPLCTPQDVSSSSTTEKVKYLLTPSEWFFIGSALSVSSAVAVVLLKIVGRISFIQPFSACVVSSIVLRLLCEICKNHTFDATPRLSEGSSFRYEGQNYYIAPTKDDGACGLHAVLGIQASKYLYEGNAREHYVNTLTSKMQDPTFQSKWEEWMIYFVQDYLSPNRGFYSMLVFNEPLVKDLKNNISELGHAKAQLQAAQEELFRQALNQETSQKIIMNVLQDEVKGEEERTKTTGLQVKLESDEYKFKKMRGCLDHIISALQNQEIGRLISENLESQRKLDETEHYRAFVRKEEVVAAYKRGVSDPLYYFATQELGLMAHMFDLHVKVFHEINGVVTLELDEGDPSHTLVEVFHSEIHFSRCERQNSL